LFAEFVEFPTTDWSDAVGQRGRGTIFPGANDVDHDEDSGDERDERHDPRCAVEAAGCGGGEDRGSVFLDEGLLDEAVAVAAGDGGHEFVAHAVGVGTADVVAFEQDLAASADAHELMAELSEARARVAGAGEDEDRGGEYGAVESAEESRVVF